MGRFRTAARFAIASVALVLLHACNTSVLQPIADTENLTGEFMFGAASDWSGDPDVAVGLSELEGQTVSGTVYVVVDVNPSVGQLHFHLDGARDPIRVDEQAPFDLWLDTASLLDGQHVLTARTFRGRSGTTRVVAEATFVVRQDPDPVDPVTPDPVDPWANAEGPLVITYGGTYSGVWQSLDPDVPAVTIRTHEPVVIENALVRGAGTLIDAPWWANAHLTVRNVHGEALPPTRFGDYPGRFVKVEGYRYVVVENSSLIGTSGIYLNSSASGATVKILRNRALNIDGRKSDGEGGYDGYHRVQFVQLNAGNGLIDSEIAWNEVVNRPYESRVEDVINLYNTTGTPSRPFLVHHNYIQGAYPADPVTDPYSGGGILLGDRSGAYLHGFANHVVGTSNYGIGISAGHDNVIRDNRVVACGLLPDGSVIASQNVGIVIWNPHGSEDFYNNVGYGNEVAWASMRTTSGRNDWWVPEASVWRDNVSLDPGQVVACEAEANEHVAWLAMVNGADIVIGPMMSTTVVTARLRSETSGF